MKEIKREPQKPAVVPNKLIPPDIPGSLLLKVTIDSGGVLLKTPISED